MVHGLKKALKGKLSAAELAVVRRSFDLVGDIAIVEIPRELRRKEKLIALTLMELHRNIKTVIKKSGAHEGRFRTRKGIFLAGDRKTETVHTESGVRMELDVAKVYFSPRLASERLRIARQVKRGEKVLVLFSGCGPFPLVIAKNAAPAIVHGIELNPAAHSYALENARLNKLANVTFVRGDVSKLAGKLTIKFDRVVSAKPRLQRSFFRECFSFLRKGGMLHYYDFYDEKDFGKFREKIAVQCRKLNRKCKILRIVKCGQLAPYHYRVCADINVS